jgi:hypothetical protein
VASRGERIMGESIKWSLWAANEVQPYIVNIAKGPLEKGTRPANGHDLQIAA